MSQVQNEIKIDTHPEGGFRLYAEMFVDLPREKIFELFADASQLERITPPWLNFKILSELPIDMKEGALIDYKIRLRYVPIKWRTEICVWEPPYRFVDQQLRGPYNKWYHEHRFVEQDGGTLCIDEVHYKVPLGSVVNRLLVQPELIRIFEYRQQQLAAIFSSDEWREPVAV